MIFNKLFSVLLLGPLLVLVKSAYIQPKGYVHPLPMVHGLDVVGCGFDITTLKSKLCLVEINQTSDLSTWVDPSNQSAVYHVPRGFFAYSHSELLSVDHSVLVESIDSYFSKSIYTIRRDKSGFLGFGSSRRTKEIGHIYERIYKKTNSLVFTLRQIIWYNLMLATFPSPTLNSVAQNALNNLPTTFDASDATNVLKFRQFVGAFGTHVVTDADMGGLVWAQEWFQSCWLRVRKESWISEQVRRKYDPLGIFRSSSQMFHKTITLDQTFENATTTDLSFLGGTESIPVSQWKDWIPSIKYQPRPVSYRLQPIYTLLASDTPQREALMQAVEHLRSETATDANDYIRQLQSIPDPPPPSCPTLRRKRSVHFDITAAMRAALCPYASYTGISCVEASAAFFTSGRLPASQLDSNHMLKSVGMGLDIANGNIKFPALQLTYNPSKVSVIPSTGRSLITFDEATFQRHHPDDDNRSLQRAFSSVEQMINQWDAVAESGEIAGGEFSRLLNAQEYRALFNAEPGTTVDITQQPLPLYRLKIDQSKARLNSFAQFAVSQLTTAYDYELYSQFFSTFGTHIILRTVLGGMIEKRVKQSPLPTQPISATRRPPVRPCRPSPFDRCPVEFLDRSGSGFRPLPTATILSDKRLGGLVDAADEFAWRRSLDLYPAVLKVLDFAPWSEFVSDPLIKDNLDRATQEYVQNLRNTL